MLTDAHTTAKLLRSVAEKSEDELLGAVADLREAADNVKSASTDLPDTMDQLNRTLRRLSAMLADQQRDIATTMENIEGISANLRELTEGAKRYPAQTLFGGPPRPPETAP